MRDIDKKTLTAIFDIRSAIDELRTLLEGRTPKEINASVQLRWASERGLEIVCEATRRIDQSFKDQENNIPWRRIIDMGNVLRHAYDKIDPEEIVVTVRKDLEPFQAALDRIERRIENKGQKP